MAESPIAEPPPARCWRGALLLAVVVMAIHLPLRLGKAYHQVALGEGRKAACDLQARIAETQAWFAGQELYRIDDDAPMPPASYAILWPFLGSTGPAVARWLYAVSSLAALALLLLWAEIERRDENRATA